jgi:hypothetical protein
MQNHAQSTMLPPCDCNPTTHLWERLGFNVILNHHLFGWFKLAKFCMVTVLDNMEDERTFSNLAFIKTKL